MSCNDPCNPCDECPQGHVPATISSPGGTLVVAASGVDQQTFALGVAPVQTAQLIAATPAAVDALCAALGPCIAAEIPPPEPFDPLAATAAIIALPAAVTLLCDALNSCIDVDVSAPLTGDGTPSSPLGIDILGLASQIAANSSAVTLLCDALDECSGDIYVSDVVNYGTDPAGFGHVVLVNSNTVGVRNIVAGAGIRIIQQPDGSLMIKADMEAICVGLQGIDCATTVGVGVGTVGVGTVGVGTVGVGTVGVGVGG